MTQSDNSKPNSFKSSLAFLLKVFGLSASLSIAIKSLGPRLPFPESNNSLALAIVLAPSLLLGLLLLLRGQQHP